MIHLPFRNGHTNTITGKHDTKSIKDLLYINSSPIANLYKFRIFSKMQSKRVWASYKWPLKHFIFTYTGDRDYYRAKLKVPSVTNSFGFEHGLDSNFNRLCWGKYSISKR